MMSKLRFTVWYILLMGIGVNDVVACSVNDVLGVSQSSSSSEIKIKELVGLKKDCLTGALSLELARLYADEGYYDEAIEEIDGALTRPDAYLSKLLSAKGDVRFRQGRFNEAITQYHQSVNADPSWTGGYKSAGFAYYYIDEYEKSKSQYLLAYEIDSNDYDTNLYLGYVNFFLEENELAVKYLDAAYAIDQKKFLENDEGVITAAAAYASVGKLNLAKKLMLFVHNSNPEIKDNEWFQEVYRVIALKSKE